MTSTFIFTVATLAILGALLSVALYFVAQKFKVSEDQRIGDVEAMLPGANCGGCGQAGCHAFAQKCVESDDFEHCYCNVGGSEVMDKIASYLGKQAGKQEPVISVLRCGGCLEGRPKVNRYDGFGSCAVEAQLYGGETACRFGCLGFGDCVKACSLNAIKVNAQTGLIEIDDSICGGCGACARACPRNLLEIRPKGPQGHRVYVACRNTDKGAVARKACKAACIGCGKCAKVCENEAITVENNVAYIDASKCRLCGKCAQACPTGAIHEII